MFFLSLIINKHKFAWLGVLLGGAILLGGLSRMWRGDSRVELYQQSKLLLDTVVDLTVAATSAEQAEQAMAAAYAEIGRIEALFSRYRSDGPVVAINRAAGKEAVRVEIEVRDLLARAQQAAAITGGAFDITIGPMIDAWGIGTDHQNVPAESVLRALRPAVNAALLTLTDDRAALQQAGMSIDLGGIAKGYAIDRAILTLQQHGIQQALVNAGGDIRCLGARPDGNPWRVGIQHPRQEGLLGVLEVETRAVATSGDYERYFMQDGIRYHHIFDPRTGQPVRDCQSVTILAPTAEIADVFATAVFVMGAERGKAFLETQPDVSGLIVRADGSIVTSAGFVLQAKPSR